MRYGPLSVAANAVFVVGAFVMLLRGFSDRPVDAQRDAFAFAGAAFIYGLAHLFRYARLLVLLMERHPTYRSVLTAHFVSAWVSALLPLRLGEFYRFFKLSHVASSWRHGIAAYAVEKFLDATFLLAFVVFTIAVGESGRSLVVLLLAMSAVVVFGVAVYVLAEGSLAYAARALLLWGRSTRSLWALHLVSQGRELHKAVRSTVRQRGLPLLGLTVVVWFLDFAAFSMVADAIVSTSEPLRLTDFLAALQETLGSASSGAGGAYQSLVVLMLSFAAGGCIVVVLGFGVSGWMGRRGKARPYKLARPRGS